MIYLVTGGSGSGKSACAEELAVQAEARERVYIATMEVIGEEGKKKVERHRKLREGKGFFTVECPKDLGRVELDKRKDDRVILLECMLNLAANELFNEEAFCCRKNPGKRAMPGIRERAKKAKEKIKEGIRKLEEQCRLLVIVSGEVFSDGVDYGEETNAYLALMGELNCWAAVRADKVVEVVCGIRLEVKGGKTLSVDDGVNIPEKMEEKEK